MKTIKLLLMLLVLGAAPVLAQQASFCGMVNNQDGEPIAGAHVRVYRYNYEKAAVEYEYTDDTDADGCFSVMVADANTTYQLAVTADGYADYVVDVPFFVGGGAYSIFPAPSGNVVLYNRLDFTAGQQASICLRPPTRRGAGTTVWTVRKVTTSSSSASICRRPTCPMSYSLSATLALT